MAFWHALWYNLGVRPLNVASSDATPYSGAGRAPQALTWPSGVRSLRIPGVYAWGVSLPQPVTKLDRVTRGREGDRVVTLVQILLRGPLTLVGAQGPREPDGRHPDAWPRWYRGRRVGWRITHPLPRVRHILVRHGTVTDQRSLQHGVWVSIPLLDEHHQVMWQSRIEPAIELACPGARHGTQ